ncbi:MAG: TIGR01440 family protein [Lachnospiraceae bacterium]|nr:TIGR01440 family protein [Lachnospiraceae bacterium]
MYEELTKEAETALRDLCEKAKLKRGQIIVIGCSSSEILGSRIGSDSNLEAAEAVFWGIKKITDEQGIWLAAQCCEHLNRAIVIEKEAIGNKETVNVIPKPKAGGSFATLAYRSFKEPVVLEKIKADAGLDIGDTLIGMHLKRVAVPLRLNISSIGKAHLTAARVRPKFIGGSRAEYDDTLL